MLEKLNLDTKVSWFSLTGFAVLIILLSGLLSPEIIIGVEVLILMLSFRKITIDRPILFLLAFLLIQGSVCMILQTDTVGLFIKQFIGISVELIFWSTIISIDNYQNVLILYKKAVIFASVIALLQFFFLKIGLNSLSNLSFIIKAQASTTGGRSASVFIEPSAFALFDFPMVFIVLYSWLGKNKKIILINTWEKLVIFFGFFVSFSTVGYIGIFVSLLIILLNYKLNFKQIFFIIIIIGLFRVMYTNIKFFQDRVNDSLNIILGNTGLVDVNLSTQTWFVNEQIAIFSLKNTFGIGGGLGSHILSYSKYIGSVGVSPQMFLLNQDDANSLALRIISELGIGGVLFMLYFLVRFRSKDNTKYKIINLMCLAYIILRLVRMGHYFNMGFGLFLILYYRSYLYGENEEK